MYYYSASNPFLNLGNNQKFFILNQNKEPNYNIQFHKDYYIEKEKLDNVTKEKNKLYNKSIKTMRLHNNFKEDNIKRTESEQKYLGFKSMKKKNNYNNIISKENNEQKYHYDNLYNNKIINLNNEKKKYESISKNNFLMNNHINETIVPKYIKKNFNN